MNVPPQTAHAPAEPEMFPHTWLLSAPVQSIINAAPVGVGLLRALRNGEPGLAASGERLSNITDFQYVMLNPAQQVLLQLSAEEVLGQPFTLISPDVLPTGILDRLRQVVDTGQPGDYVEVYKLDGITGRFYQVYLKSGDGVLMLVHDVSYRPLTPGEQQQHTALLHAILTQAPIADVRARLIGLVSGHTS